MAGTARRLRRNLRRLYLGGRGAITLLVGLAVATLVIAIVVTLSRDLMGRAIRIDAIQVPKTMAEAGISSEVAARQLRDSMNSVIAAASSGSGPVLQLASDAPDIVVPTVGISFSTLSEFVRSAMGMNRRVISGEITGAAESARMRLRIDGHVFHETVDADMRADEAWLEAAKAILRQTAPYIVAWALQETDPAAAVAEANRIIARLPPEDENVPWAHLLRAACALDRGMWERARGDIDAALRASHGKSAAAYLYRGRMLIEQARWGDAAAALQSARFFDRTDPAIDHYLALALWGRGDLKGARAWFADSERKMRDEIRREPGNVTTLNSFANSLAVQGRIQEALEMSRWAVDLAPQSGVTRLTLALREQEAGLDRAAIESAREAARLAPASHTILVSAAGLIAAGPSPNLREGLRLLDRATDADPDYVLAYVERARLLKRLGRLWDAEADIARALSLNPATYSAQYEVGTKLAALHQAETADRAFGLACAASLPRHPCLLGWSDALRAAGSVSRADTLQDEALKELDRLTRAFWRPEMWLLAQERERKRGSQPTLGDPPPLPAYLAARCETLTQSDRAAAREHCERAVRLAPKETVYREKLALLLASDGDGVARDRAIGILGEAFAANPDSPSTLIALAKQFEAGGDFEAARLTWAEAVMHDEDNGWLQNQLAVVLAKAGFPDQALPHYRTAWTLLPEDVVIATNLARALSKAGAHEEALAPARYVYEHQPNNQDAVFRFIDCLRDLHRWEEARDGLDSWISVHPRDGDAINKRGGVFFSQGLYDRALADVEAALAIEPANPVFRDNREKARQGLAEARADLPKAK